MRVAFPYIDRRLWQGGYHYLLNLLDSLALAGASDIKAVVFAGDDIPDTDLEPFESLSDVSVHRDRHFARSRQTGRQISAIAHGRDRAAERIYRALNIDGIFENAFYHGSRTSFPILVWIPDFQHRHLRKFFPARRYWKRELGFRAQLSNRRHVLVSSNDARADLERFYPSYQGDTHILRFCASLPETLRNIDFDELRSRYDLPPNFFYLPNQLHHHKNHILVLEALRIARELGDCPAVIASGSTSGSDTVSSIKVVEARLDEYQLRSHFRVLGSIPYKDVLGLMLASQAVINPSLFEGWSTTVEEAKALGTPLLLSNIDVHIEQTDGNAMYFDPVNAQELAEVMLGLEESLQSSKRTSIEDRLLEKNRENRKRVANEFAAILKTSFL